jgi:hypothetical protein
VPKSKVTFSKVKGIVYDLLENQVGKLDEFEITFAKLEDGEWRVNAEFVLDGEDSDTAEVALFTIDAESGEVSEYQRGSTWRE